MKKLLYLVVLSCSSILSEPRWGFTLIEKNVNGETYSATFENEPAYYIDSKNVSTIVLESPIAPHSFHISCFALSDREVIYSVAVFQDVRSEMGDRRTLVKIRSTPGYVASYPEMIDFETAQGAVIITFSSKI